MTLNPSGVVATGFTPLLTGPLKPKDLMGATLQKAATELLKPSHRLPPEQKQGRLTFCNRNSPCP